LLLASRPATLWCGNRANRECSGNSFRFLRGERALLKGSVCRGSLTDEVHRFSFRELRDEIRQTRYLIAIESEARMFINIQVHRLAMGSAEKAMEPRARTMMAVRIHFMLLTYSVRIRGGGGGGEV
jgi:hypothetical protein